MSNLVNMLNLTTKNNYAKVISHSATYIHKPFNINLKGCQTYKELFEGVPIESYKYDNNEPAIILSDGKSLSWDQIERVIEVNGIKFFHLNNNAKTREFYVQYLTLAKETTGHGEYVLLRAPEEYVDTKLFIGENGCGGTVIEKDKSIVSLSKNKDVCENMGYKGIGDIITLISIANGGNKIECWKGFLTEFYIRRFGFIPITSIPFSADPYSGEIPWNYERDGTPDIVFIGHNGDSIEKIIETSGTYPGISTYKVKYANSYDEANILLNKVVDNNMVNKFQNKKTPQNIEFTFN